MSSYQLSEAAKADLKSIAKYTQITWGSQQRRVYLKELDLTFQFLAQHSDAGVPCNYISPNCRKYPKNSHIIFYEIRIDHVFIIRVLHKSMDVESRVY